MAALKHHRASQLEWIMRHRDIWADNDLVFPWLDGTPWHPKRFSAAFFRRMKQLGVNVSFHGLRHSYASILLRAGTPLKVASEALGHSSVAITADLYTHVLGELQREAADRLGQCLTARQASASD
jgi:integrase